MNCNYMTCRTWMLGGSEKGRGAVSDIPAVEVKQKARPAIHDDATVPNIPVRGSARTAPIVVVVGLKRECVTWECTVTWMMMGDRGPVRGSAVERGVGAEMGAVLLCQIGGVIRVERCVLE